MTKSRLPDLTEQFEDTNPTIEVPQQNTDNENITTPEMNTVKRDEETGKILPGSRLNPIGIRHKPHKQLLSITNELRRQLLLRPRGQQRTYLELLVKSALNKAIKGQDPRMISEIFNRVDGLPTQKIQIDAELRIEQLANQLKLLVNEAIPADIIQDAPNINSSTEQALERNVEPSFKDETAENTPESTKPE